MRTVRMAWAGLAALVLLGGDAGSTRAAPAPAPRADRWEYAELQYTASSFRGWDADDPAAPRPRGPRGGADGAGGGRGGGRGGGAGGPGGAAAQPDQPAQPVRPRTRVRWVTGDGEVEATSWEELASKLKAPEAKGTLSVAGHKVRVLNHLGNQGWELVSAGTGSTSPWVFKRKAPK